ncbi:MAG: hypothetical protein AAGJ51_09030 [Pseudomonadota bacterium]
MTKTIKHEDEDLATIQLHYDLDDLLTLCRASPSNVLTRKLIQEYMKPPFTEGLTRMIEEAMIAFRISEQQRIADAIAWEDFKETAEELLRLRKEIEN